MQTHKENCLGYTLPNNLGKNVYGQNISSHKHERNSNYTSHFDSSLSFPLNNSNPPSINPVNNLSPGGHFLSRNSISVPQQSPVFNALLSNQNNSFYNTMFGVQTSHNNQNSYSTNFTSFNTLDSSLWLSESLIPSSNPTPLLETERNNRNHFPEKNLPFNDSNLACCSNRLTILDPSLISPRTSTDSYKKDYSSKPNNNSDPSNWFCNQNMIFNKNSNIQQTNYKCNDQYSYPLSHLNPLFSEQNSCFTSNLKPNNTNTLKKNESNDKTNDNNKFQLNQDLNNDIQEKNFFNISDLTNNPNIYPYNTDLLVPNNKDILEKSDKTSNIPIQQKCSNENATDTAFLRNSEMSNIFRTCCPIPLDSSESFTLCTLPLKNSSQSLISPDIIGTKDIQNDKENCDGGRKCSSNESSSLDGESDIIVEETQDLIEDEIMNNQILLNNLKNSTICFLCNGQNENPMLAVNFLKVTLNSPVTKIKRTPIIDLLSNIVKENIKDIIKFDFLCNYCFELIDSFEKLEIKLSNIKLDIKSKFKSSTLNQQLKMKNLEQMDDIPNEVLENNLDLKGNETNTKSEKGKENLQQNDKHLLNNTLDCDKSETQKSNFCNICNKCFSNKHYLNKHLQQHTKKFSYYCERCGKGFIWKRTLRNHLLKHEKNYKYQCEICGRRFLESYLLKVHIKFHKGEFRFKCSICNKGFMCKTSFKRHSSMHTKEKPFVCEHCGKSFRYISNLKFHIKICSSDFSYSCEQCNKKFAFASQLETHIKTKHEGEYKLRCEICDKGFLKNSCLKKHLLTHSGTKPFKCDICGKYYSNTSNLRYHLRIHNNEKKFKCDLCNKEFLRRDALETHKNTHTNTRPFKCDKCDKSFSDKRNLQTHLKWHNGTLKKTQCEICNKIITHSYKVHLRTHTGEKPHKCSFCSSAFSVKSSLKKHIKSKHKSEEYNL